MSNMKKALFICLGNTCRSPIAEGVFQKMLHDLNLADSWEVDSAALADWHVGSSPNWRAMDTMRKYNVPYNNNTARQIVNEDFHYYDYIFGMDDYIMEELNRIAPNGSKAKLFLLGNFDPTGDKIIRDPYCDSDSTGFEKCYQQCLRSTRVFLDNHRKI